ncbi:MAG: hypothetical protein J3Q66DRAFT_334306 [Benniella sp.]|nr:MAG: hypothetical protein J3Q66DRAFT_334306 [Benniella sp.]
MAIHATDIAELRQRIARHLDRPSLKACSLVCKAWYLDFHSVLWERFSYEMPKRCLKSPEQRAAWLDIVSKKAHLFRHIHHNNSRKDIVPELRDILLDRCHDLITIEAFITSVKPRTPVWNPVYWEETLRPLIEQNKISLRRLQLRDVNWIPVITSLHLPGLLASLSRLQSLELGLSSTLEDLLTVLEACPISLECFGLLHANVQRKQSNPDYSNPHITHSLVNQAAAAAPSLRLKHLSIHGWYYDGTTVDLLSYLAGHSLESLQVDAIIVNPFSLQMSPTLRDTPSRLTDLHIKNRRGYDRVFLMLLDAIPPQQLRNVHLAAMNVECASMLVQKHHQSLESLVTEFVRGHARVLGDILATCCNLKYLKFGAEPFVDIRALVDPQRPWVCSELEVFEGYFGLPPSLPPPSIVSNQEEDRKVIPTDQVENLFMQRVGQLTKLRRLVQSTDAMGYFFSDHPLDMEADAMTWTLSSGLGHLADLVNLEWLEFEDGDLPAGIGIPELLFIKQHWHGLQGLACYNIDAAEVQEWLAIEWPELEVKLRHGL